MAGYSVGRVGVVGIVAGFCYAGPVWNEETFIAVGLGLFVCACGMLAVDAIMAVVGMSR